MIVITYNIECVTHTKEFANNKSGTNQSVAFLEALKLDHLKHPYFYLLPEIKHLDYKIKTGCASSNTINSYRSKQRRLENERYTYLKKNNIIRPLSLSVSITNKN